ncbi:MAG: YihY/virulence factor BrkB family protein [Bacilli bacterium]|nr:YihY/virulence factor BrkB family protein [Bacilli bacterium]
MKSLFKKIGLFLNKINNFDNKFQITKNSASLSFYILLSLVSVFLILFQILSSTNALESFFLTKAINLFSDSFSLQLQEIMPAFNLSGFSVILLFNTFYSASKTINGYNRIADYIYFEIKNRVGWKNRISAFLMFSMLMLVFLFEVSIVIFGNYLIKNVLNLNIILIKFIQLILEFSLIFATILILFLYVPPRKMRVRDAYKGAFFSAISIYLLLTLFVIIINFINRYSIGLSVLTLISYSLFILFIINYILIVGLVINYYGNISQLRTSLLSK